MMNKITVSAPGKLMLLGEYAVLYNRPCLVTAVDKRLYTTVEIIETQKFQLEAPDVNITGYKKPISKLGKGDIPKGAKFVELAVKNLNERYPFKSGLKITSKSEFSPWYGFGSSSATTVCTIKAVSELFDLRLSKKELFDISYKTILDIQGKGSGFDIAAAVYGGTLFFKTGGKVIEPLDIKSLPLVVGFSGMKADTVKLINKVKEGFSNRKNRLEEIYNKIEDLVDQGKDAFIKKDWVKLGILMNKNQDYLRQLGVSTDKLDRMIRSAVNAGSYGAKLSGAGGGDCITALVSDEKSRGARSGFARKKVTKAIQTAGGEVIDVKTGAEGVRIE